MAGHSKFKNIQYRKGAQDKKRGKIFTKLVREIIVSAKSGIADPAMNSRLRSAIIAARAGNMPKDKIDAAIKRGSGENDGDNYEEIRYEGYGPSGVAIIVDTLTDNHNRTASEVRSTFTKHGGNLGATGSVSFMFDRLGQIIYQLNAGDEEEMLDAAIEAGADDCVSDGENHIITCELEELHNVSIALEVKFGDPESAKLVWIPQNNIPVDEIAARTILKLIDVLEDNDDVQEVTANFDISDEILLKLSEE